MAKEEVVLNTGDQLSPPSDPNAPRTKDNNQRQWPSTGRPDRTGSPQNLGLVTDGGGETTPKG